MKKQKKEEKKKINLFKKNKKVIFFFIILILSIFLMLIVINTYLYINLLLGNDVLITLNANEENFFLIHGESANITFKTSVLTNPFCYSNCSFSFIDLSSNEVIDKDNFKLRIINPITKEYTIQSPEKGTGQILYRFNIQCKSQKTALCQTTEEKKSRNIVISINYDLTKEEKYFKDISKEDIIKSLQKTDSIKNNFISIKNNSLLLKEKIDLDSLNKEINKSDENLNNLDSNSKTLIQLWQNQDYHPLADKIKIYIKNVSNLESSFNSINYSFYSNVSKYNSLIENITHIKYSLKNLKSKNLTNLSFIELDNLIEEFNQNLIDFNKSKNLAVKEKIVKKFTEKIEVLSEKINKENNTREFNSKKEILDLNFEKIELIYDSYLPVNISLVEPVTECCLFKKCVECCDERCADNSSLYPILFLHGHDFSRKISAEHSLDVFSQMQEKFEEEGYLDAGSIFINLDDKKAKNSLGRIRYPISLRTSYYLDIFTKKDEKTLIQTKEDSIDSYALRLNDIINIVKSRTGKNKINVVAYSMGGLVVRRYMQIFKSQNINKIIMISSPNYGLSGTSLTYCSVFGEKIECNDMDENSLFMNKLNRNIQFDIPVYNLVGIGCKTDNANGDGIVKKDSATLPEGKRVKNIYVNGTCNQLNYFHTEIINPDKYPEVFNILKNILKRID